MITGKVDVKSNKKEVENELEAKIEKALSTIGMHAETGAKELCPVDTGNLRNSLTHETLGHTEYIGTNVEYGIYVEFDDTKRHNNGQAHFLRDTITGQFKDYQLIIQNALKD